MNILTLFEKAIRTFKFNFIVELRSNNSQNNPYRVQSKLVEE